MPTINTKPGDVILIARDAIGNPRATRVRVDRVVETSPGRYEIWGIEVTRTHEPRVYFGHRYSEWHAFLRSDDFVVLVREARGA